MAAADHDTLIAMLDRLKLTAIRDQLDALLDEAARSDMTLRESLAFFVQREIPNSAATVCATSPMGSATCEEPTHVFVQ